MSNVVFILGAGCSKHCGAPLMADFLDVASSLHTTNKVGDKATHFEKVFKAISALQTVHSKSQLDLNNIESIFSTLDLANTIGKLPGFTAEEIPDVLSSLKEVIVTTLERTINFQCKEGYIGAPFLYNKFAELLQYINNESTPMHTVSVITFNYDIALDVALYRTGLGPEYFLTSDNPSKGIPLLKLHGSLNWAIKHDNNEVIPLALKDYFSKYHVSPFHKNSECYVPIGSQLKEYFDKYTEYKVKPEPVLVPPTWNKTEYHQVLSEVWGRAAKELSEAEYIFIIGYSLPETDAFFRLLYAIGTVGEYPLKKIEIFNPENSDVIKKRFKSLMGPGALTRYDYIPMDFNPSIKTIKGYF